MAATANIVELPKLNSRNRVMAKAQARGDWNEYSFQNTEDLAAFVAKEIRESRIKYTKLADKAGVCSQTVSRLAHGETTYPRAHTLFMVLKALGFEIFVRG